MRYLIASFLLCMSMVCAATPKPSDIQAAIQKQDYAQAERLLLEVLEAQPKSAKAHYVYAEVLAKNARLAEARAQLAKAKELDPTLKFAKSPEVFKAFEEKLGKGTPSPQNKHINQSQINQQNPAQATAQTSTQQSAPNPAIQTPAEEQKSSWWASLGKWALIITIGIIVLIIYIIYKIFKGIFGLFGGNRNNMQNNMGGFGGMGANNMPMGGSSGGGIGSHLLTGAGGFAAGMLVDRMLNGNDAHASNQQHNSMNQANQNNDGGYTSIQNEPDFSSQEIDYGSGGDSWDSGSSDNSSSSSGSDSW